MKIFRHIPALLLSAVAFTLPVAYAQTSAPSAAAASKRKITVEKNQGTDSRSVKSFLFS